MNARAYVSLSREKRLGIPAGPSTDSAHIHKDDVDDQDDAKSRSAFTENMPGILSVDDIVSKVNLADLKVKLRGEVHSLGVSDSISLQIS